MRRGWNLGAATLTALAVSIVVGGGIGSPASAQGKGKKGGNGKVSADVPLCVDFDETLVTFLITGDGSGNLYCDSDRKTTVEFQIDNGSNDLIMNLGRSTRSRVYHIDLSNPESDTLDEGECPAPTAFAPQDAFFFQH